jgi:hypothetical protein
MGLKNWLAKNIAGVGAYGGAIGRSTAENGLALGRVLYLSHGTYLGIATDWVFDDAESMAAKGYRIYCPNASECPDPSERPPMEDGSKLSILTRAAGVAFAAKVAMNAAHCFSDQENYRKFKHSLGSANASYLSMHGPDVPLPLIEQFVTLPVPKTATEILDFNMPGTGDVFEVLLKEISNLNGVAVGFQRRGPIGFETWVVTLAEQMVSSIQKAAMEFKW